MPFLHGHEKDEKARSLLHVWQELLALRLGYRFGIEEYTVPSAGIGLNLPFLGPDIRFDYGFSQIERLGTIHRISLITAF